MVRKDLNHAAISSRKLYAITNNGISGSVMCYLHNTATPFTSVYTVPTLSAAASAGGPTAARAMKASLTMVNDTQRLNQGGKVYTLVANQRLRIPAPASTMTQAEWNTLMDEIIAHPHTRAHSGADFVTPKTLVCHPSNIPDYTDFKEFEGTSTVDGFWAGISTAPSPGPVLGGVNKRPMSTIFVVFEPPAVDQTYTVTARASWYTRWPLDTIMGQSMKPIPTAPLSTINGAQDQAEHNKDEWSLGPAAKTVAQGAMSGVAGAVAAAAVRQRHRRPPPGW